MPGVILIALLLTLNIFHTVSIVNFEQVNAGCDVNDVLNWLTIVWNVTPSLDSFLTIYMHQFLWLTERRGNFLNLFQKEGGTQKGEEVSSGKGGSNPGGNYDTNYDTMILVGVKL